MSWNPPDLWATIVLGIGGGFLAGLAVLALQWGLNILGKRRRRSATVEDLRRFFQDWEAESNATAVNESWQFVRHEQMIRRMNENLILMHPTLSGCQWSDIAELIRRHEELIDARRKLMMTQMPGPVPEHFALLPDEYRDFFEQANKVKWLKLDKAKPRK